MAKENYFVSCMKSCKCSQMNYVGCGRKFRCILHNLNIRINRVKCNGDNIIVNFTAFHRKSYTRFEEQNYEVSFPVTEPKAPIIEDIEEKRPLGHIPEVIKEKVSNQCHKCDYLISGPKCNKGYNISDSSPCPGFFKRLY